MNVVTVSCDRLDWISVSAPFFSGMHKKSIEMSKKCPSSPASDSTRPDSFCITSERRGGGEAREAEQEEELVEEEEDAEEEVAIDLSSSSKQQHHLEEGGRPAPSLRRQSGSESDEHSWRSIYPFLLRGHEDLIGSGSAPITEQLPHHLFLWCFYFNVRAYELKF